MDSIVCKALEKIKAEINAEYGFHEGVPRINYGPCGVFAQLFFKHWNRLFANKVRIGFVLTHEKDDCDHVIIQLPTGDLYDGGVGIHSRSRYEPQFCIEIMNEYDEALLEKWSYGLDRTYPRFCPQFNRQEVEKIIVSHLEEISNRPSSSTT